MYSLDEVRKVDPEIADAIVAEENRQSGAILLNRYGQPLSQQSVRKII